MSASNDDIRVRIAGDLADINRSLQDLRRQTRGAGTEARNSRRDWDQLGRGLDSIKRQVLGVVGAYLGFRGITALVRGVIRATTEQERVQAQLEARIRSTAGAAGFTADELGRMASELQAATVFGDEAILDMQGRLLSFTNITGERFRRTTEAVLNLSTAMGTDLNSASLQLGRALNDPIRNLSALSRTGIQFSRQQEAVIRSLQEAGDLAGAQSVILDELENKFGGAARAARNTFGGAIEGLKNAVGDLMEGGGGNLEDARQSIEELTALLSDPATQRAIQSLFGTIVDLTRHIVTFSSSVVFLFGGARDELVELDTQIGRTRKRIEQLEEAIRSQASADPFRLRARNERALERERAQLADLTAQYEALAQQRFQALSGRGRATPDTPVTASVAIDARPALQDLQAQLAAAGKLLQDELRRLGQALDRDFQDNLVRFADYYRERAELETRAVDQRLEEQRASLALIDEEIRLARERGDEIEQQERKRRTLVAEITVLERQRADVAANAAREQARAERELVDQLDQVRTRLRQLQGDTAGARADQLEREFRDLLARLEVEGDAAGEALVRELINVELARTRLQELEGEYARTLSNLERAERRVQLQVDTGVISERAGRREIIRLHQETAREVEGLIPLMEELAAATGDPAAIERIESLKLEVAELASVVDIEAKRMRDSLEDAGVDAFASFLDGTNNARDAFQSFVDDVRRRIARLVSERIFDQLFSMLGGLGGAGGGGGGFFARLFHAGGVVGQPGPRRRVPAIAFAGAPRLHNGGIPGLRPGEVPAILERGERVLSRREQQLGGSVTVNIQARDVESFRRESPGQIGASIAASLLRAQHRNS